MSEPNRFRHDQAATLRMLVKRAAGQHARRPAPRPWRAAFLDSGEGDTAPRWCLEIAKRFSRQGLRTIVIDADLRRPRVHTLLSLPGDGALASWLADDVSLHEALVRGPEGLLVLTGGAGEAADWLPDDASVAASLMDLDALGPYADAIFAAIGGTATSLSANLVRSARIVAATFDAGDESILGTYATLKRHASALHGVTPALIADEADPTRRAAACERLTRSLDDFLGIGAMRLGVASRRSADEPRDLAGFYDAVSEDLFRIATTDRTREERERSREVS